MRWIDKPRKKTRSEIILEYIKFLKIMGYYDRLVRYMYFLAKSKHYDGSTMYVQLFDGKRYNAYPTAVLSHNRQMINYLESILRYFVGGKLQDWIIREKLVQTPLRMYDFNKSWDLTELMISYFKDKHIYGCIIID